jgi:hypothetical protein
MSTKTKSTLRLLLDTIVDAVMRVDDQYEKEGLDFPSLNDPFDPADPASTLLFKPEVAADIALVVAATEQLSVTMRPPSSVIMDAAFSVRSLDICSKLSRA